MEQHLTHLSLHKGQEEEGSACTADIGSELL